MIAPNNEWHERFLQALAEYGVVQKACDVSGVARRTAYHHKETNEDFAKAWHFAVEAALDAMELEAIRRAKGWQDEYKDSNGNTVKRFNYSDRMLEFLLKSRRYKDDPKQINVTIPAAPTYKAFADRMNGN